MADQDQHDFRPPRLPLMGFHVQWRNITQRFQFIKDNWQYHERQVPAHIAPLLDWGVVTRNNVPIGKRFKDLFYAKLDLGDDDQWQFAHALGRGGFGAVALFEKHDRGTDTLTDQVVVKTTKAEENQAVDPTRKDLALEAALMDQTNSLGDGMLTLRDFKYYSTDCQWRFYFEYCPYGDLERLRVRYKAYGRYLPELFLWHTFYWLARTLDGYSTDSAWFDTYIANWGEVVPNGFLLHCDIKTANILLGPADPDMDDAVSLYPIPRVADLGLAEIQSDTYTTNKAIYLRKGTESWFPPEIRFDQMLRETDFYPFGARPNRDRHDTYRKARHQVTSAANVWAVGAVMFSLLSLQESHVLDTIVRRILREVNPIPGPGTCIITDDDFNLDSGQYYSMALRDLIKDCLKLRPSDRPAEHDLREQAFVGYTHCLRTLQNQGYGSRPDFPSLQDAVDALPEYKLYFRENEIDSAPDNYQFDHQPDNRWWLHRFIGDYPWVPPAWGRLFPDTMPTNILGPPTWPQGFLDAYNRMRNDVYRQRRASTTTPAQGTDNTTVNPGAGLWFPSARNGRNMDGAHDHHLRHQLRDAQINDHHDHRAVAPSPPRPPQIFSVARNPRLAAVARNPAARPLDSIDQALLNMGITRTSQQVANGGNAAGNNGRGARTTTRNGQNGGIDDSSGMGGDVAGVQRTVRPPSRFTPY